MVFSDIQLAKKSEKQGFLIGVLQCHFYRKDTVIKIWGVDICINCLKNSQFI